MAVARGRCLFPWRLISRAFSSPSDVSDNLPVFDRPYKRKQRDRAAWLMYSKDPLLETVTDTLLDRLKDCKRTFPTVLNLGGAVESVRKSLTGHDDIERLVTMDMSHDMIKRCLRGAANEENNRKSSSKQEQLFVVGDEEFLPFKEGSFDLIVSCLGLHWVNDLAGAIIQCRMALKPDGLFLAAMLGGETLRELRIACTTSQLEREGGISPRLSPLARVQDAGNLLTRAGLALTTVDVDQYTVQYPSAIQLIEHLRSMGECNAVSQRNQVLKRETALAAASVYESMFKTESGTIPATFQVIYMAGWSPHSSQPKSKGRGSATVSFEDLQEVFAPEDAKKKVRDYCALFLSTRSESLI